MKFIRTIPERRVTYEVRRAKPFMTHYEALELIKSRGIKTPKSCFLCGNKFKIAEGLFLAYIEGHGGKVICESCGEKCPSW